MARFFLLSLILFTILLTPSLFAEVIAEVSFVTSAGEAYVDNLPPKSLKPGLQIKKDDILVLESGAKVRLLYPLLNITHIYKAPKRIKMADEYQRLRKQIVNPDQKNKALTEITKLKRSYIQPVYSQYAGSRSLSLLSTLRIHDRIPVYNRTPRIVIQGGTGDEVLSLWEDAKMTKTVWSSSVPAANQPVVISASDIRLEHGKSYYWSVSGESTPGELITADKEKSEEVLEMLDLIQKNAIESSESSLNAAIYLLEEGFWVEAYHTANQAEEQGADPGVVKNLKVAIINNRPEDILYQQAVHESGPLGLRYSFHIKRDDELKEIYNGDVVHSGDLLKISVQPQKDCYLFILNFDAGGFLYVLFPHQGSDHFVEAGTKVQIPPDSQYFKADNQTGEEQLILIASKQPLDHLAIELDRYFSRQMPSQKPAQFTATDALARGFSTVVEENGEPVQTLSSGTESFKLSRFIEGEGLFVKEIKFHHLP